ncbi:MAG: copper resistance protein CopC [Methyloprofundus sp.]|nr:copper resistance protein CopC [Methyloprofundus sp.]
MTHFNHWIFSTLILLTCYTGSLYAHAVVTEHSIKIEAIRAHQAKQVKLTFNSSIELGLSQVFLVRKGDVEEKLPVRAGQAAGEVLIDMPALDTGEYAVHYKIFAADGHITDDIIHFTVQP